MSTPAEHFSALRAEFQRLGLDLDALPEGGIAADVGALGKLLQRVRSLEPPVTWRDIFPDIPSHWIPGHPKTWTRRYRPLGPYDHPSLPTGPAIHVAWPKATDPDCLSQLIDAARAAGWPVHGAGFVEATNPAWPTLDAMIVLNAGTSEARLDDFLQWIDQRSDVELAAVPRRGNEQYVRDP